ncbi:unnamed protein product [Adineta steineri]|uniref:Uncharacterized protein n=1 Tax=Adineta steineri TaxID=433720 RepID=A0A815C726_9BILA|nr:unnamed protein product [Adineta steineri]CAF1197606.1 unnamed protein product [Adineta steineri]CAF1283183.1 unnamed protein product [Adineta steineri]
MALANGVRFIWLDTHIGRDGEYQEFKRRFQNTLEETAAVPPVPQDPINALILALELNGAPFLFAHEAAQAVKLIKDHHDKQIIFITSGSLGQHIIPNILASYPYVYRFYIFCNYIENYTELGIEYSSCLQMFNHETDLLVRLTRDISKDIIKQGEIYMNIYDLGNALKCFEHAVTLNVKANQICLPEDISWDSLRKLNGHGNSIGLIQQARDMQNQEQQ